MDANPSLGSNNDAQQNDSSYYMQQGVNVLKGTAALIGWGAKTVKDKAVEHDVMGKMSSGVNYVKGKA